MTSRAQAATASQVSEFACRICRTSRSNKEDAQRAFTTWPAYRVSQGTLRTMQWRLNDCFRQQRWPEPVFASPATVDLITFLGVNANGAKMDSPSIKR